MVTPPGDPSPGDRIELRGLRIVATHGVLEHEQHSPQPFELDIDLLVDTSASAGSDDLADTADYGAAVSRAHAIVAGRSHLLIESLASEVAEAMLEDPHVREATVTLRKLRPPVPFDLASAAVKLTRCRKSPV